jgi:predicted nuclease of predicted toxin-antitoxin system
VRWLADENFRNAIIRGLLRKAPAFDIVRAQDVPEVSERDDLVLLQFATAESRVVLTHDLSTMVPAMREQMRDRVAVRSDCHGSRFVDDRHRCR